MKQINFVKDLPEMLPIKFVPFGLRCFRDDENVKVYGQTDGCQSLLWSFARSANTCKFDLSMFVTFKYYSVATSSVHVLSICKQTV